jgi:hypothetical protein
VSVAWKRQRPLLWHIVTPSGVSVSFQHWTPSGLRATPKVSSLHCDPFGRVRRVETATSVALAHCDPFGRVRVISTLDPLWPGRRRPKSPRCIVTPSGVSVAWKRQRPLLWHIVTPSGVSVSFQHWTPSAGRRRPKSPRCIVTPSGVSVAWKRQRPLL